MSNFLFQRNFKNNNSAELPVKSIDEHDSGKNNLKILIYSII